MKPPWSESRGLIPWMLLVTILLFIAVIAKEGILTRAVLLANKDVVDTAAKLLASVSLAVGGLLSYFRFFKGRLLRPKLVISCQSGMIPLARSNMHWLNIQVENRGSVAIWNYELRAEASYHGQESDTVVISNFLQPPGVTEQGELLVDVGESSYKHALLEVPKDVQAVSFRISVTDKTGSVWDQFLTVSNQEGEHRHAEDASRTLSQQTE
jgi:hypothetical protein